MIRRTSSLFLLLYTVMLCWHMSLCGACTPFLQKKIPRLHPRQYWNKGYELMGFRSIIIVIYYYNGLQKHYYYLNNVFSCNWISAVKSSRSFQKSFSWNKRACYVTITSFSKNQNPTRVTVHFMSCNQFVYDEAVLCSWCICLDELKNWETMHTG